jgi:glycosyltransferase XagB
MDRIKNFLTGHPVEHFESEHGKGFLHRGNKYIHHSDLPHHETAFYRLSDVQKLMILAFIFSILISLLIDWRTSLIVFIAGLTIIYFGDLLFNLFLIIRSFRKPPEIIVPPEDLRKLDEKTLPNYTVLCPLYKEWKVVPQFIRAMQALDYPKEKLQVMLLLEEDDKETVSEIRRMDLPNYFDIVVVPHSLPKTKPKALNYGIKHTRGEMVVIYDAEDVPERNQLKKAVLAFRSQPENVKCIQAKLNFYNPRQNILTRVFTAEYSLWFDLVLTGLQSIHAPIPLGGTSNHFKKTDIIELKGWDSFNVTEDCDLGMRIVKKGYRTAVMDSTTYEEANSGMMNWFDQRTRWIKGYIQTYFVHMRSPHHFLKHLPDPHVITFQLIVGGKIASMLINPIMWGVTISYFLFRSTLGPQIEAFYPTPILYLAVLCIIFGNFLYLYYYMVGCAKRGQWSLIKYVFLVPVYWLAMSAAAYTAWYRLVKQPHYWSKTKHGLHLEKEHELSTYAKVAFQNA